MTPDDIETQARARYNAINDTFWSQDEIRHSIYDGELELAMDADAIENTSTSVSVSGTADYAIPARTLMIKRLEYNGVKLNPISQREADALSLQPIVQTTTGTPLYYTEWDGYVTLIPTPAVSSDTITFQVFSEPTIITSGTQTLDTPTWTHAGLVNFVLREMAAKDENAKMASYYDGLWQRIMQRAKKERQRKKRGDAFAVVKTEENLLAGVMGRL